MIETDTDPYRDIFSPAELVALTNRVHGAWQSKQLDAWGVRYRLRKDGSVVLHRADVPMTDATPDRKSEPLLDGPGFRAA